MSAYDLNAPVPLTRPPAPYPLRPYQATGEVAPPLVLVEGPAKVGKGYRVAESTGDPRICHTWWIEWGEKPCAEEYGAIPGADIEIVPHDGSFWAVLSLLEQLTVQARDLVSRDAAPMVVIDTGAGEWKALRNLAHQRTLASPSVRRKLARDPLARADAHSIPQNTWHDINDLHDEFMALLKHFPGIAVIISRGREVAAFDDNGQLIPGEKTYRVEGHKDLQFDCSAWVRLSRTGQDLVYAARSVRSPIRPGIDEPREFLGLPWLVFDVLAYEPKPWEPDLRLEELRQLQAGEPRPADIDWDAKLAEADRLDIPADRKAALNDLWKAARFQQQRFGTVPDRILARIEKAGHEAAEALRLEVAQAWDEADAERDARAARTNGDETEPEPAEPESSDAGPADAEQANAEQVVQP